MGSCPSPKQVRPKAIGFPLFSNIFLHYVLDEWFSDEVRPRLRGPSTLVRFADDFVMLFAYKDDRNVSIDLKHRSNFN